MDRAEGTIAAAAPEPRIAGAFRASGAPLRLGLIGAGLITRQSHLPAAIAAGGFEVAAIVDPAPARAERLAADFALSCSVAADLHSVVDRLDAVVIATPNDSHAQLALTCIRNGVHVLVEKPLASSVAEAEAVVAAAAEQRVTLAVGYVTRFRRTTRFLKQLLDQEYFGKIRQFFHQFGTVGGWSPLSGYSLGRESVGGGVLVVTGTHFLDRMLYFWGCPDEVELEDDSLGGPEANCLARFSYATRGMKGSARYSKTVRLPGGLVIESDRGLVVVGDHDGSEIRFRPTGEPDVELVVRESGAPRDEQDDVFRLQLEDFADAIRSGHPSSVDGSQGLRSMKLIDRLYSRRRPMAEAWRPRRA